MNKSMKKLLATFSFALLFIFSSPMQAQPTQPPGPPGGGGGPGCWPPPCVPIDGGISWLLLVGAAYGGKKIFDSAKKEEGDEMKA